MNTCSLDAQVYPPRLRHSHTTALLAKRSTHWLHARSTLTGVTPLPAFRPKPPKHENDAGAGVMYGVLLPHVLPGPEAQMPSPCNEHFCIHLHCGFTTY